MDSSLWVDSVKPEMIHCKYLEVAVYNFQIKFIFLSPKSVFVSANSVDPDAVSHCLPTYAFRSHKV